MEKWKRLGILIGSIYLCEVALVIFTPGKPISPWYLFVNPYLLLSWACEELIGILYVLSVLTCSVAFIFGHLSRKAFVVPVLLFCFLPMFVMAAMFFIPLSLRENGNFGTLTPIISTIWIVSFIYTYLAFRKKGGIRRRAELKNVLEYLLK